MQQLTMPHHRTIIKEMRIQFQIVFSSTNSKIEPESFLKLAIIIFCNIVTSQKMSQMSFALLEMP